MTQYDALEITVHSFLYYTSIRHEKHLIDIQRVNVSHLSTY